MGCGFEMSIIGTREVPLQLEGIRSFLGVTLDFLVLLAGRFRSMPAIQIKSQVRPPKFTFYFREAFSILCYSWWWGCSWNVPLD